VGGSTAIRPYRSASPAAIIRSVSRSVLPPPEEWAHLAPAPQSVVWRRAGDPRVLLAAGYALVLQVAHPTVGAGVSEHSSFREDPWGRLLRTLDAFYALVYGGPEAAAETGRSLRTSHRTIRGLATDGRRYHALEPEAYAWVHATLADAIVLGHAHFGDPLDAWERERFWVEWRDVGRLLGVRARDLPAGWGEFEAYVDCMVRDRLERTTAVDDVLRTLAAPGPPPVPLPLRVGWPVAGIPLARALLLATTGMLPPLLRERFDLGWSRTQELELDALARGMRAMTPVLGAARIIGPTYLRLRRAAHRCSRPF
jgi:uncharacterized protein (DUF2236 family)